MRQYSGFVLHGPKQGEWLTHPEPTVLVALRRSAVPKLLRTPDELPPYDDLYVEPEFMTLANCIVSGCGFWADATMRNEEARFVVMKRLVAGFRPTDHPDPVERYRRAVQEVEAAAKALRELP